MTKNSEERRLWIGNLDPRINETGPLTGQPRGYAFVTYTKKEDAIRAKDMHNKRVGSKNISVSWAHAIPQDEPENPKKIEMNVPGLALAKTGSKIDREFQIRAIEAKLKLMEKQSSKELEINKTVATERPVISQFQFNRQGCSNANYMKYRRNYRQNIKPYEKCKNRK